ncbi:hypothetical protein [Frankia sp. Cppng1_Ct_nod]|uniref:hypothetical protein n=1 Tax=Frankia sp. Cppng1_Ct_nod TaxID=2897162 RepID=UPI00104108B1|nr:hypothetical protein [Frankia sp. Cppng1_Ct_nod]
MTDSTSLDAIALRLLTAQRATLGVRRLANAAVELGEPVDAAGVNAILAEFRQAYREVHEVLVHGDPADIVYLAAQLGQV